MTMKQLWLLAGVPPLTVYTGTFYASIASFITTIAMNLVFLWWPPLKQRRSSFTAYLHDHKERGWALLAGLCVSAADICQIIGGQALGYAFAFIVQVSWWSISPQAPISPCQSVYGHELYWIALAVLGTRHLDFQRHVRVRLETERVAVHMEAALNVMRLLESLWQYAPAMESHCWRRVFSISCSHAHIASAPWLCCAFECLMRRNSTLHATCIWQIYTTIVSRKLSSAARPWSQMDVHR